jgi:hypothetical protein
VGVVTGVLRAKVGGQWVDISSGSPGPPGPAGGAYVHNQGAPATTWVVVHNLGYKPNITVEDSSGTTVEGELVHDNANQATLTFSAAFAGVAYCS